MGYETAPMYKFIASLLIAAVSVPSVAYAQQRPLSLKNMPAVCGVLPVGKLSDFRSTYPDISCGWNVDVGVSGGMITGGIAGIDITDSKEFYNLSKQGQQQLIDVMGKDEGVTVNDKSGISDCAESRMVVLIDKHGVPSWSYYTAICSGLVVVFTTVGPEFTTNDSAKFGQIVRMAMEYKIKAKK